MEDKTIKGALFFNPEEIGLKEIKINEIKKKLNFLKEHLAESNNYRCNWDDFDVAIICWLTILMSWNSGRKLIFKSLPGKKKDNPTFFQTFDC